MEGDYFSHLTLKENKALRGHMLPRVSQIRIQQGLELSDSCSGYFSWLPIALIYQFPKCPISVSKDLSVHSGSVRLLHEWPLLDGGWLPSVHTLSSLCWLRLMNRITRDPQHVLWPWNWNHCYMHILGTRYCPIRRPLFCGPPKSPPSLFCQGGSLVQFLP